MVLVQVVALVLGLVQMRNWIQVCYLEYVHTTCDMFILQWFYDLRFECLYLETEYLVRCTPPDNFGDGGPCPSCGVLSSEASVGVRKTGNTTLSFD